MQLSQKQIDFINNCNERWNGKIGATRCGKTYLDIVYLIPKRIIERRGKKGIVLILGVSKSTIERNILTPMREIYGESLVGGINSENICKLFGQNVYCLGAEKSTQVSKIRGSEVKYCYCDELVDFNEEIFEILKSRLSLPYSVCDFTGNPADPGHWLKKFIDSAKNLYIQNWQIYDNPFLSEEFIQALEEEYAGTVYYNRYILGEWQRAEGLIYKKFANNNNDFIVNDGDVEKNIIKINIGIDFGGTGSKHAFVATAFTRFYNDVIVLESERHDADTSPDELDTLFCDFIKMCHKKYGKFMSVYCDNAEQVLIRGLRDAAIKNNLPVEIYNAKKMPIKDRVRLTVRLQGQKRFWVKMGCKTLINSLNTAVWDDKGDRLDNNTVDIDTLDAFEYTIEPMYRELIDRLSRFS